jgi:ACS family hexuronate transporter-like MFS transporter
MNQPTPSTSNPADSRRQRWRYFSILALLFLAAVINYIDRQTLSILKPLIKTKLSTDDAGYALLVNVFTFGYALAYMVAGWITDRIGSRIAFVLFVVLWSLATLGCGMVNTFTSFMLCRGLLGLAEPGYQPVTIRALTLWVPVSQRGFTMSLIGSGGTVGSIIAAPVVAGLASAFGWHVAFLGPAILGLAIAVLWWFVYRHPEQPAAAKAEAVMPPQTKTLSWGQLWQQPALWGIVLARFISDPVWYFCLFWLPGYFQEQRGLTLEQAGIIAWIPYFAASLGGISLATVSDRVVRRMERPLAGRVRVLWILALFGPVAALVPHAHSLWLTLALLCVVAVVCLGWLSILGPLVADAFPAGNVGSVWGIAGAFGACGAIIFNYEVGRITSAVGSQTMFLILGGLHLIAAAVLVSLVRERRLKSSGNAG